MTVILVLANLLGCYLGPKVGVIPSGAGVPGAPKGPDCKLDFFRSKIDRPYDELAALHVDGIPECPPYEDGTLQCAMGRLQDAMRVKACQLGADAVLVTQDYSPGAHGEAFMNGIAIKYRPVPSTGG